NETFVPDDQTDRWISMVNSGEYSLAPGQRVSYVDRYGQQTVVDPELVLRETQRGEQGTIEDTATVSQRNWSERIKQKSSTIGATGRGLLSGLSFGLTDRLVDPETIEADKRFHGTARIV